MKETDKKIPSLCTLSAKGYRTHLGLEATQTWEGDNGGTISRTHSHNVLFYMYEEDMPTVSIRKSGQVWISKTVKILPRLIPCQFS